LILSYNHFCDSLSLSCFSLLCFCFFSGIAVAIFFCFFSLISFFSADHGLIKLLMFFKSGFPFVLHSGSTSFPSFSTGFFLPSLFFFLFLTVSFFPHSTSPNCVLTFLRIFLGAAARFLPFLLDAPLLLFSSFCSSVIKV